MGQPPQGQPYGQQPGGPQQGFGQPPAGPMGPKNNVFALIGLICGIVSLTIGWSCGISGLTAIAGIILSAIGLSQIKKNPQTMTGRGMALGGLITSIIAILLFVVVLILVVALGLIDELT